MATRTALSSNRYQLDPVLDFMRLLWSVEVPARAVVSGGLTNNGIIRREAIRINRGRGNDFFIFMLLFVVSGIRKVRS